MSLIQGELKTQFDEIVSHYPVRQAAVIPLLHLVQEKEGKLTVESQQAVAEYLGIPATKVHEVVSFYSMFTEKPRGKNHLLVCRTLSCALTGCQKVLDTLEERLDLLPGEVTPDGKFSYEEVECLAACDLGAVVQVGDRIHGHMTPESVEKLINDLKNK